MFFPTPPIAMSHRAYMFLSFTSVAKADVAVFVGKTKCVLLYEMKPDFRIVRERRTVKRKVEKVSREGDLKTATMMQFPLLLSPAPFLLNIAIMLLLMKILTLLTAIAAFQALPTLMQLSRLVEILYMYNSESVDLGSSSDTDLAQAQQQRSLVQRC